jgi:hypothetical protein
LLAVICLLTALPLACQNPGTKMEPTSETKPTAAPSTSVNAPASAGPSASIDELAPFVQLPVRPAAVSWQHGLMGKNQKPDVPGPADGFLIAVLSYAPADAERLVAAQSGPAARSDVATAPWFPPGLLALAHPNAEGRAVLSGSRYVTTSYARAPFSSATLQRIGTSGWFVLVLSTS